MRSREIIDPSKPPKVTPLNLQVLAWFGLLSQPQASLMSCDPVTQWSVRVTLPTPITPAARSGKASFLFSVADES